MTDLKVLCVRGGGGGRWGGGGGCRLGACTEMFPKRKNADGKKLFLWV